MPYDAVGRQAEKLVVDTNRPMFLQAVLPPPYERAVTTDATGRLESLV